MNVQHVLLFCCTTVLYPGIIPPVAAEVWTAAEGATDSISCLLPESGNTKYFCRNECEAEDIIIKTENDQAESGRISIKYTKISSIGHLEVTFTRLTPSDSGQYRCGLGNASAPDEYSDMEIRVSNSPLLAADSGFVRTFTVGETIIQVCKYRVYGNPKFFCRNDCNKPEDMLIETDGNTTETGRYSLGYAAVPSLMDILYVAIKQAIKSDSGRYKCGYGTAQSPDSLRSFEILVTDDLTTSSPSWISGPAVSSVTTKQSPGYFWPLVACWPFLVLLVVLPLILYRKLRRRNVNVNTSGNADAAIEAADDYEIVDLALKRGESVYQDLQPACRDPDQIYSLIKA